MTLSVLIPAFNERATIAEIIERVLAEAVVTQVIIVDDGSTDGTREFLQGLPAHDSKIEVQFHSENQGKGAAIRTAIDRARGQICIIQDADLEYHQELSQEALRGFQEEINKLLMALPEEDKQKIQDFHFISKII